VKIGECEVELRLKLRDALKLSIRLGTQHLDALLQVCDYFSGNADRVGRASLAALTLWPAFTLSARGSAWPAWPARAGLVQSV